MRGGVLVSTVASQQEGPKFDSRLGHFCVEFACSPRVCMYSLQVLQLPPTSKGMHVRLIGVYKLFLGVSVSLCVVVCLVCLCVAL